MKNLIINKSYVKSHNKLMQNIIQHVREPKQKKYKLIDRNHFIRKIRR